METESNLPSPQTESNSTTASEAQRNFAIPGCSVVIHCEKEGGVSVEQFLAIAFQLAASNPGAKIDFWVKVTGE